MMPIQSIQDEYAKNIAQKRGTTASLQGELSEATHPLLIAHLFYLRRIKSVPNKPDETNKNAETIKAFNFLCERNLLFFLRATNNTRKPLNDRKKSVRLAKKNRFKARKRCIEKSRAKLNLSNHPNSLFAEIRKAERKSQAAPIVHQVFGEHHMH